MATKLSQAAGGAPIISVHLADVGVRIATRALRRPVRAAEVPGLSYCETVAVARIAGGMRPSLRPGAVGLIAAWEEESALDGFLDRHHVAETLAGGWQVRMRPLRVFGAWPRIPGLSRDPLPADDDEPIAALTLGRPRLRRAFPFFRSASAAEADAVADPAMLASAGLARPPRLVSTFSMWRSVAAMRAYANGPAGAHRAAVSSDRERPFHHESAFIRLRPYAISGSWDGGGGPSDARSGR